MPYIKTEQRYFLDIGARSISAGELNYKFTKLMLRYLKDNGHTYKSMNDIIGALEAAKMEFYRRVMIPYENKKIVENSDVYPEVKIKLDKQIKT